MCGKKRLIVGTHFIWITVIPRKVNLCCKDSKWFSGRLQKEKMAFSGAHFKGKKGIEDMKQVRIGLLKTVITFLYKSMLLHK